MMQKLKTGVREDGTIYSVYSFARKLGQALSSGMIGALLSVIGYSAATAFNPEVVNGIFNMTVSFLRLDLLESHWY